MEARRQGIGATVITTSLTAASAAATNDTNSNSKPPSENSAPLPPAPEDPLSHPLSNPLMDGANLNSDGGGRSPTPPLPAAGEASRLQPVTANNIATRLTSNDVDRIRILVRE